MEKVRCHRRDNAGVAGAVQLLPFGVLATETADGIVTGVASAPETYFGMLLM